MKQPMPRLALVELDDHGRGGSGSYSYYDNGAPEKLVPLSTVIRSFRDTRALKLRVNFIEDIIDVGEDAEGKQQAQGYALPVFPYLHVLELEGQYKYMSKYAPATMATLLASCPKLTELRLRLSMMWDYLYSHKFKDDPEENLSCSLDQYHFTRSVERFKTFNSPMASFRGSIEDCCAIPDLPLLQPYLCPFLATTSTSSHSASSQNCNSLCSSSPARKMASVPLSCHMNKCPGDTITTHIWSFSVAAA
jgi:hypothetical protein